MSENPVLWNPLDNTLSENITHLSVVVPFISITELGFTATALRVLLEREIDTVGRLLALGGVNDIRGYWFGAHAKERVANTLTQQGLRFANIDNDTTVEIVATGQDIRIPARAELAGAFYPLNRIMLPVANRVVRCDALATTALDLAKLTTHQVYETLENELSSRASKTQLQHCMSLVSRMTELIVGD